MVYMVSGMVTEAWPPGLWDSLPRRAEARRDPEPKSAKHGAQRRNPSFSRPKEILPAPRRVHKRDPRGVKKMQGSIPLHHLVNIRKQ